MLMTMLEVECSTESKAAMFISSLPRLGESLPQIYPAHAHPSSPPHPTSRVQAGIHRSEFMMLYWKYMLFMDPLGSECIRLLVHKADGPVRARS